MKQVRTRGKIEFVFEKDDKLIMIGDNTVPAICTYSEGTYRLGISKKIAGDWEVQFGKIAGFHGGFCC